MTGKQYSASSTEKLVFNKDKYYTFVAYFSKIDSGYALGDDFTATVNGENALIKKYKNDSPDVGYCFGRPTKLITDLSVTGVIAPVSGAKADFNWDYPTGQGYKKYISMLGYSGFWYETDSRPYTYEQVQAGIEYSAKSGLVFKADKYYTFVAEFDNAEEGYKFADTCKAKMNGYNATIKPYGKFYGPNVWYCFGKPAPQKINEISITGVTSPVVGKTGSYNWNIPTDKGYKKGQTIEGSTCSWVENDTAPKSFEDVKKGKFYNQGESLTFKADKYYTMIMLIDTVDTGYIFTGPCTVTVNGALANVRNYDGFALNVWYYFGQPSEAIHNHTPKTVKENVVNATCTKEGSYDEVVKCAECNTEIIRTKKTLSLAAHTPQVVPAVASTCTKDGLTEGSICSVCKKVLKAQETVKALGHTDADKNGKCDKCSAQMSTGKLGDVNGDGKINTKDAKRILRSAAKLESFTDTEKFLADVNKDGKVNTKDAKEILRYSAKLSSVLS